MRKIFGYLFAGLGILILAGNSTLARAQFDFLDGINKLYILVPGIALVCIGVAVLISLGKGGISNIKHVTNEVPIYKGEGKKRKIVGYKVE